MRTRSERNAQFTAIRQDLAIAHQQASTALETAKAKEIALGDLKAQIEEYWPEG